MLYHSSLRFRLHKDNTVTKLKFKHMFIKIGFRLHKDNTVTKQYQGTVLPA